MTAQSFNHQIKIVSIPSPKGPPLIGQARELIAGAPRFTSRLADE